MKKEFWIIWYCQMHIFWRVIRRWERRSAPQVSVTLTRWCARWWLWWTLQGEPSEAISKVQKQELCFTKCVEKMNSRGVPYGPDKKLNALLWFLRNANWIVCCHNRCNGTMKYVSGHIEFETPSWKSTNFRTSFWLVSALMSSAVWLLSRAFSWRELDSPSGWVLALFSTLSTATWF